MEVIGMKFNSFVMRVILIASIVLSIILSWKIWTNNTHYERRTDSQTTTKAVSRKSDRKISDIFLPTQILWRTNQQSQLVIIQRKLSAQAEGSHEVD